ncbi:MAG: tRNA (adenosine(37)-N6)-dimethylallyltransferase MiaA [Patescibacteria group bacterium]|nr:tRNA (adenosine(37)-N6)-dimethylallyltransferase MiaA [Patescibacteria group bacterium]MDD5164208.1 tRNA (adenosine(37)-N6)-dimethylallyltransferase MiaA [Patescibacteria group bacterium]MDD5534626.1 tRNA (adenosine(37)-N6)-dimethylallyltransferase MiaA [Patescibacteria group bacterium]
MSNRKKLIVILGPTASGKTDIALKLAKKISAQGRPASGWHGVEIICADSRTIYKGMDIGTAKAVPKTRNRYIINGIQHHMIDIIQPNQEFTVAQFKQKAIEIIDDIQKRNKTPFLVGGTGLYISSLVDNFDIPAIAPDEKLRKKLEKMANQYGPDYLWKKLIKLDPEAKKFIQKENIRRVIRALEVCLKTKKPFSQARQKGEPLFKTLLIGINLPRQTLYQKINQRVDKMIDIGLIDEVKKLIKKYLPTGALAKTGLAHSRAFSGIGYKEIISYLRNEITLPEATDLIKKNTRHYAKRQITWFKRDKRIKWIKKLNQAQILIKKFLA